MEKVRLPKEIADAIGTMKSEGMSDQQIMYKAIGDVTNESLDKFSTLTDFSYDGTDGFHLIMLALVNGYEVEETPEDKVREYYNSLKNDGDWLPINYQKACGIIDTLNLLNIKIEGVNT